MRCVCGAVCTGVCVEVCVRVCVLVYVRRCVYLCMWEGVSVCTCVCVVCVQVYVWRCVYKCMCGDVCTGACVEVCESLCSHQGVYGPHMSAVWDHACTPYVTYSSADGGTQGVC